MVALDLVDIATAVQHAVPFMVHRNNGQSQNGTTGKRIQGISGHLLAK